MRALRGQHKKEILTAKLIFLNFFYLIETDDFLNHFFKCETT